MRFVCFMAGAISCAAAFAIACGPSDDDNTVYGPPDAGKPDADYCVSDIDCPPDNSHDESFACGFPIADACEARGICIAVSAGSAKCPSTPNYCGCDGNLVTTCPLGVGGYVRGGPTNGKTPTTSADGGVQCGLGS